MSNVETVYALFEDDRLAASGYWADNVLSFFTDVLDYDPDHAGEFKVQADKLWDAGRVEPVKVGKDARLYRVTD